MKTKQHITLLKNHLPNINSLLEIQCGGGYDIENCEALQDKNLSYIGVDVVDETIYDNRQYFREEKNKIFMVLDASNEPLPKTDLVVCVGMAPYLPIANVWSLLENIRDSGAKYFVFDYYHLENELNSDIKLPEDGERDENYKPAKRPINLTKAPFYFPKPKLLFPSDDIACSVALYEIADVSFFMDWHNDDVSKIRSLLIDKMEAEMAVLEPSFLKEANGKELFKEMMVNFLEIGAGDHNQKYYYDEPFKTIIDRVAGLEARNAIFRLVYRADLEVLVKRGYDFLTADNFIHVQILAKDYIRWRFGLSLFID